MDIVGQKVRSRMMASVRSKDTKPERIVRSTLHSLGFRFRLHKRKLPGVPDIVLPRHHAVIFVHGCFWHQHPGCKKAKRPTSNTAFWDKKLDETVERDISNIESLQRDGWSVLVIWECQAENIDTLRQLIAAFLPTNNCPH